MIKPNKEEFKEAFKIIIFIKNFHIAKAALAAFNYRETLLNNTTEKAII